jgi:hypothetical protein
MKQKDTVFTGITHPFRQYQSQSQMYYPHEDMPLHQALYVFNIENTILQCIKHEIMYMGNKIW